MRGGPPQRSIKGSGRISDDSTEIEEKDAQGRGLVSAKKEKSRLLRWLRTALDLRI
jgi:hypothetical protein